jgi:hypothetical protein
MLQGLHVPDSSSLSPSVLIDARPSALSGHAWAFSLSQMAWLA